MKNNLRERRAEKGWTQADLGMRLGISRQSVIAIENEKFDPSLPLAFAIAGVFGASIEDIFGEGQKEFNAPRPPRQRKAPITSEPMGPIDMPTHML